MGNLKDRIEQIRRAWLCYENGMFGAAELREKLAALGVTVSDDEFRSMTRDDDN